MSDVWDVGAQAESWDSAGPAAHSIAPPAISVKQHLRNFSLFVDMGRFI